ncbi:cytochrome P450 [Aspergillus bertholletiae]|uniref:Cytochrome P450 n=1 Tax=Aspergillus bertholletiae TaxID=1226010 RepID=A0A5N7BFD5_9EURO|nr:cytochrome P450 [Aspergillus bertholletiae]
MLELTYTRLLLLAVVAEVVRRVSKALIVGFTGPLAKVPGPFWNKLSALPWRIAFLRGTAFLLAQDLHRKYGDIVRVAPNLVLVSDFDSVHKVLFEWDLQKSPVYEKYRQKPHITTLFTERDKAKYRVRRRLLSNGFSVSYLKSLEPLMLDCIDVLQEVLEERCSAGEGTAVVNIYDLISSLASDIMSESSFGGSFGLVRRGHHPLKTRITNYLKRVALFQIIPLLNLVSSPRDGELDATVQSILDKRLHVEKSDRRKDLLQILLEASAESPDTLSQEHIKAEMFVFLLAGSDTSAATATFCLMKLLENPATYQTLVQELDALVPCRNDPIVDENIRNLPYLNAVIYETLRLLPPAAGGFARQASEPIVLQGYALPEGTLITADTTTLHRDPRVWPDADWFIPGRWVDGHKGVRASERNWYPFSAGSRTCIGKQFALKEVRLLLAILLRRFEFSRVPDQDIVFRHHSVLYIQSGKYLVNVRPRMA